MWELIHGGNVYLMINEYGVHACVYCEHVYYLLSLFIVHDNPMACMSIKISLSILNALIGSRVVINKGRRRGLSLRAQQ